MIATWLLIAGLSVCFSGSLFGWLYTDAQKECHERRAKFLATHSQGPMPRCLGEEDEMNEANPIQMIERTTVHKFDKTEEDNPEKPCEVVSVTSLNGKCAIHTVEVNGQEVSRVEDAALVAEIAKLEKGLAALEAHGVEPTKIGGSDCGGISCGD